MLITASGGCYRGTNRDFLAPYVNCNLSFMGVSEAKLVAVEGLCIPTLKEENSKKADAEIDAAVEPFRVSFSAKL